MMAAEAGGGCGDSTKADHDRTEQMLATQQRGAKFVGGGCGGELDAAWRTAGDEMRREWGDELQRRGGGMRERHRSIC